MSRSWATYWREVCAPKLKRRKAELGRTVPEHEIASYVEMHSGKNSGRGSVSLWLLGKREPYISQFFALCHKLGVDPVKILDEHGITERQAPLGHYREKGVRKRTPAIAVRGKMPKITLR